MDVNISENNEKPFNGIRFSTEGINKKVRAGAAQSVFETLKEAPMITTDRSTRSMKVPDKIFVDEFLVDLIPNFIKNKIDDLAVLKSAIENNDFETVRKIGHNWKGVCSSYGFKYLGETGKQFEYLAENKDAASLRLLVESLPEYLKNVQIESIPEYEDPIFDGFKN